MAPLCGYLPLNCLFYAIRPLLCSNPMKLLFFLLSNYYFIRLAYYFCVLWSELFLLMHIVVLALCAKLQGPLPAGGNPIAIYKYRIVTEGRKSDVCSHNFLYLFHYHYTAYTPPIPTPSSWTQTNQTHCPTSTLESREGMQNKLGSGMWRLREATNRSGS